MTFASAASAAAAMGGLFHELGDLKRLRSAGHTGSIASRGFRKGWAALCAGMDVQRVMEQTTASALAAVRLGDLDGAKLLRLGLSPAKALAVLERGFDEVTTSLDPDLRARLRGVLASELTALEPVPPFVDALDAQPRAGATCPGKPRLMLEPPEDHSEHCWAVAVFGVVLSPIFGADPATVFLAAMAHHLHNAMMPDSGFTGEMLLGDALEQVCEFSAEQALNELEPPLRDKVRAARRFLPDAETAEGRAFHAADVIDRVLQIEQHLRAARTTMDDVLNELGLVHEGPVKAFHDRILAEMGLL